METKIGSLACDFCGRTFSSFEGNDTEFYAVDPPGTENRRWSCMECKDKANQELKLRLNNAGFNNDNPAPPEVIKDLKKLVLASIKESNKENFK